MKPWPKAMLIAAVVESVFAGTFAVGGFGPCGPGNPIGLVGMLAHLPGFAAWLVLSTVLKLPEAAAPALIVALQFLFWAILIAGLQRAMRQSEARAEARMESVSRSRDTSAR